MKKKLLAILFGVLMIFALAACSSDKDDEYEDDTKKTSESSKKKTDDKDTDDEDDNDDDEIDNLISNLLNDGESELSDETQPVEAADSDEIQAPETEAEDADSNVADETFSIGTNDGTTYSNSYFNIGVKLEGWTFLSDEEILAVNQTTASLLDDDFNKLIEASNTLKDLMATAPNRIDVVDIIIEKLSYLSVATTEQDYICDLKDSLVVALGETGIDNVVAEIIAFSFAGNTHPALHISCEYEGIAMYVLITAIEKGNYVAVVEAYSFFEDNTEAYLGAFYALN